MINHNNNPSPIDAGRYLKVETSTNYGASWTTSSNVLSPVNSFEGTRSLELGETTNYRSLLKKGKLVQHTTLKGQAYSRTFNVGTYTNTKKTNVSGSNRTRTSYNPYYGCWDESRWLSGGTTGIPLPDLVSYVDESTANAVLQRAAGKAYGSVGVDGLTFAVEFHRVRELFLQAGTTLMKWKMRDLKGLRDDIPNLYLAVQFGLKPFISDVLELSKAVQGLRDAELRMVKGVHAKTDEQLVETRPTVTVTTTGALGYVDTFDEVCTTNVSYRSAVQALVKLGEIQLDPILTAYEMTRWTFLLDYFFTVGAALNTAHLKFYADEIASSYGYMVEQTIERSYVRNFTGTDWITGTMNGSYIVQRELVVRVPAKADLQPRWQPNIDSWKVANMVALATSFVVQKLRPKKRRIVGTRAGVWKL